MRGRQSSREESGTLVKVFSAGDGALQEWSRQLVRTLETREEAERAHVDQAKLQTRTLPQSATFFSRVNGT